MSLKHIIKYMAVPVVAAFALVGCSHEDFTTAPKSSAEQTEKTTKKRTIKIRLSADIELPKGTGGRGIGFNLDPSSERYRPYIKWDEIKDKIQTRLYFRKMVKNEDGEMVPSQDRHDIFSVVIEPDKWTVKDAVTVPGHLKLSTDIVDPKSAKQRVMEIEVPENVNSLDATHPFLPASDYPKNTPQEATSGTVVPETKGEWQVAAILSVDLNGDYSKGEEGKFGYEAKILGSYFPEQLIMKKLGTGGSYGHHDIEFEDTDDEVKPFKYDGYWMLYPKTMYFDHNNPNPQKPDDPDEKDPTQAMEIPFCADWKNVEVDERGVVGVELQAKSPGMILHYELIPDDVEATDDPTPIASARGLGLASRRAKQGFRQPTISADLVALSEDALDNLKSTACTFYGALWYDQVGDKVHWSRGTVDLTEYDDEVGNQKYFMKENTLSVYVRSANVSQKALEQGTHCHILYFVMPPYDGKEAPAGATTAFWLQPKEQDYDAPGDQPSDYSYLKLSYQLKKKGGQFQNQYISTTKLSPGKIHWVRLQYKKLPKPIDFNPDAQP
ncbi:hypothetical protein [Porphyromonas sp.]